jgi:NTE family protein
MAIASTVYSKVQKLNVFIEPILHEFGMFDVNKADKIFETGYKTAMQHKDQLLKLTE